MLVKCNCGFLFSSKTDKVFTEELAKNGKCPLCKHKLLVKK